MTVYVTNPDSRKPKLSCHRFTQMKQQPKIRTMTVFHKVAVVFVQSIEATLFTGSHANCYRMLPLCIQCLRKPCHGGFLRHGLSSQEQLVLFSQEKKECCIYNALPYIMSFSKELKVFCSCYLINLTLCLGGRKKELLYTLFITVNMNYLLISFIGGNVGTWNKTLIEGWCRALIIKPS